MSAAPHSRSPRDVRLDFFRGIAMFVIFVAHVPANSWFEFIPARFGFSSAAELFVFCSGVASSFAFGRLFQRQGFSSGLFRTMSRIWQVYWAHIGMTLVMIIVSIIGLKLSGTDYPTRLGLGWFYAHPAEGVFAMMTLTYTPAYLDMLPVYLVLLAMLPLVMLVARLSPKLALGSLFALWGLVQVTGLNLPGGQGPGNMWYFNPFAWQLVFFTGFAFGMGWLKAPDLRKGLLFWLCVAFLLLSVPVNFWAFTDNFPLLASIHDALLPPDGKTNLHPLLYLHFLASAYVVLTLIEPIRGELHRAKPVVLVGQQALATFMASTALAWSLGMVLDIAGRGLFATSIVNLIGFAGIVAVAALAQRYKSPKEGPKSALNLKAQPAE
ncbi:MAG: OpgC domain-containing protein [Rhizobiales bacterium]|nr:OpgC domain-containing protein [Hyphomicrobiales bacterium]